MILNLLSREIEVREGALMQSPSSDMPGRDIPAILSAETRLTVQDVQNALRRGDSIEVANPSVASYENEKPAVIYMDQPLVLFRRDGKYYVRLR